MKNTILVATSIATILTIADELYPLMVLPLGGSSMAQMGILFFGIYAVESLALEIGRAVGGRMNHDR